MPPHVRATRPPDPPSPFNEGFFTFYNTIQSLPGVAGNYSSYQPPLPPTSCWHRSVLLLSSLKPGKRAGGPRLQHRAGSFASSFSKASWFTPRWNTTGGGAQRNRSRLIAIQRCWLERERETPSTDLGRLVLDAIDHGFVLCESLQVSQVSLISKAKEEGKRVS